MCSLRLSMGGRNGLAILAGTFALLIALPRTAEAGRGASTRSDGGVSSGGTASGSSGGSSGGSTSSSSSSSGGGSSSASSSSGWSDSGRHAVSRGSSGGSSKPGRDDGGARNNPNDDEGRFAVPSPGAGERGGRQPNHGGGSSRHHRGGSWGGGYYWDPYYYGGYYGYPGYGYGGYGWGWSWRGWWWPWGPAGVMYDRPYRSGRGSGYGALDLDVWPGDAEIYVDGERAGTADDFDGFPTYLWLPRGTYDVAIYLPGFRTLARQYSIYDGLVIDVNDRLEQGEAVRPEDLPSKSTVNREERQRRNEERAEAVRRHEDWRRREADRDRDGDVAAAIGAREGDRGNAARLHLDVTPSDASVYLDGNFLGTAAELQQLSAGVVVAPGSHKLEVVRPGYQAEDLDFDGAPGEDVELQVELDED